MSNAGELQMDRIGVIDIGSNSVRMVIYECFGASATPIYNEKILAGLGRDLKVTGKLYPEGAAQTLKALVRFKAVSQAHALGSLHVVATAALRQARDAADFIKTAKAQSGLDIRVLSGEQEAQTSAYGVIFGDQRSSGIMADLGGASLELIHIHQGKVGAGKTYPVGPFAIMGQSLKVHTDKESIAASLKKHLSDVKASFTAKPFAEQSGRTLYLVGGAWRNLVMIDAKRKRYPLPILHNFSLSPEAASELANWACDDAGADLLNWQGINSRRAETLPYCGLVLQILLDVLKPKQVVISPAGLREGVVYQAMRDGETQQLCASTPLYDACQHLAMKNPQGLTFAKPLNAWLSSAAEHFASAFEPETENRMRMAACYLAGMGKGLHPDHRADLVFTQVLYAPLAGLTHKERAYLALMLYSSYRSAASCPNDAAIDYHLLAREKLAARTYGTALRLASVISARAPELLSQFTLSFDGQILDLTASDSAKHLFNRQGHLRLKKLADLLGAQHSSNWAKSKPHLTLETR